MTLERDGCAGAPPCAAVSAILLESYGRILGEPLVPGLGGAQAVDWLYEEAPYCVLAHDTAADPRFIYANKAAQRCFEYPWEQFTALPSRLSAEAPARAERRDLLNRVARDGFVRGYRGLRISRTGRRFFIEDGILWQLIDAHGDLHGQGAMFPSWRNVIADPPPFS